MRKYLVTLSVSFSAVSVTVLLLLLSAAPPQPADLLEARELASGQASPSVYTPVTDARLTNPSPEDWLMYRRTYDSWGYSPLDQINRDNVRGLRMVWTRDLEQGTGEVTPLAYGGILYVPQAQDVIQALDAVTGDFIWEYGRSIPDDLYQMVGGNARNNRNVAIYDQMIINTSDDN